jgi:hypothetical protein
VGQLENRARREAEQGKSMKRKGYMWGTALVATLLGHYGNSVAPWVLKRNITLVINISKFSTLQ